MSNGDRREIQSWPSVSGAGALSLHSPLPLKVTKGFFILLINIVNTWLTDYLPPEKPQVYKHL